MVLDDVAEAPLELLRQHRVGPAVQRGSDDGPSGLEGFDQLHRSAWMVKAVFPSVVRPGEWRALRARLAGHAAEPVDAGARDVRRDGPDRPIWRAQRESLGIEVPDAVNQAAGDPFKPVVEVAHTHSALPGA